MSNFVERMRVVANALGNRTEETSFTAEQLREQYGVNFCRHFYANGVPEFGGAQVADLTDEQLAYLSLQQIKRFLRDCITASVVRQIDAGTESVKSQAMQQIQAAVTSEEFPV